MLLARRKFVLSSLLFTSSTVFLSGNVRSGLAQTLVSDDRLSDQVLRDPLYRFTRETFEAYVGDYFEAPGARGQMVALKLVSVKPYVPKTRITTGGVVATESFTLLFNADGELPIFSSIHPIKHKALGEFSLFLTQLDGPNGQIQYEAVINHLR